eukprot:TRINITY_DN3785_c0_g1_i10.p1 TRINITY_DN3785_c0_g1~~TRINITY_DN3785_c0_g1_i10.p1  ORF type:complete len:117 (-),score=0.50 TRINITY_DN3785_c0_g1_i10:203-553(-)
MIPCLKCDALPEEQVRMVLREVDGTSYNKIIIRILDDGRWFSDPGANCEYVRVMIAEISKGMHSRRFRPIRRFGITRWGLTADSTLTKLLLYGKSLMGTIYGHPLWWIQNSEYEAI